jgi:osmoprotectant transport system ATP-binding protein
MKEVTKKYGDFYAVKNLTMEFPDNEITILIGPSGCGKTTSMKMINGLIPKTSGDIIINDVSIDQWNPIELRRHIGYVIQEIGLFPHYTIFDNIAIVPRLLKWDEGRVQKRVMELLDIVNLEPTEFAKKYPSQLSGGQRQRIGVARGLASDPEILLMDEPFGAIDPINREIIQDGFLEIQKKIKKTIVFVTHDIHEAIKLGDGIAILDHGSLVQYDSAFNVVNNPANEMVADILGSDRALKGLELLKVKEHMSANYTSLPMSMSPKEAAVEIQKKKQEFAFVLDAKNRLRGYVAAKDLEKSGMKTLELLCKQIDTLRQFSTLLEAMTKLFATALSAVPVVDDKEQMIGIVKMKTVLKQIEEMAVLNYEEED